MIILSFRSQKREQQPVNVGVGRILRLSAADWPFLLTALVASFAIGATMPVYAYLFSEVERPAERRGQGCVNAAS